MYRLDSLQDRWSRLATLAASVKPSVLEQLNEQNEMLDGIVDLLRSQPESPEILTVRVYSDTDEQDENSAQIVLALDNGQWLVADDRAGNALSLSDVMAQKAGHNVIIHAAVPWPGADSGYRVFTQHGLYSVSPEKDLCDRVPLGDGTDDVPVLPFDWRPGQIRSPDVAVVPSHGGKIWLFEGGKPYEAARVNELYPEFYWLQRPVEWRREQLRQAVAEAGLVWPWDAPEATPGGN